MKNIPILLTGVAILLLLIAIYISQPKFIHKIIQFFSKLNATNWLAILTGFMLIANIIFVVYTHQANSRSEKVFFSQNKPLIDITPIGIKQVGSQMKIFFSIANYSGFKATNIGWDLKYGGKNWILEWRKARDEKEKKGESKGVVEDTLYLSRPEIKVRELGPGKTIQMYLEGEKKEAKIEISGDFDLENSVCTKGPDGVPVFIRITWENEHRHIFDEVHEYKLICTKDVENGNAGDGRSFTFIPQGIVNKKD